MQTTTVGRSDDYIELPGRVVEVLPAGLFRVELDAGLPVLAYIGGRLRQRRIRIVLGDTVRVAVSTYDPHRGRIVFRN